MPQTAELPKVEIRQVCPGCGRSLPLTLEHFDYCPRCEAYYCRTKCMRYCLIDGVSRCYICMEQIAEKYRSSGLVCEKCADFLNPKERR